jgi:hypothetical protein
MLIFSCVEAALSHTHTHIYKIKKKLRLSIFLGELSAQVWLGFSSLVHLNIFLYCCQHTLKNKKILNSYFSPSAFFLFPDPLLLLPLSPFPLSPSHFNFLLCFYWPYGIIKSFIQSTDFEKWGRWFSCSP